MFQVQTSKGIINFTFAHYRDIDVLFKNGQRVSDATICRIVEPSGDVKYGVATCSVHDNFNKIVGRKVALKRALLAAGYDRKTRSQIWSRYHDRQVPNASYNADSNLGSVQNAGQDSPVGVATT